MFRRLFAIPCCPGFRDELGDGHGDGDGQQTSETRGVMIALAEKIN
jgi:hypothetical protein